MAPSSNKENPWQVLSESLLLHCVLAAGFEAIRR